MRWYRLSIGNYGKLKDSERGEGYNTKRYGGDILTLESNVPFPRHYNPTPLNIEFEVQSFAHQSNISAICGIKLYAQSLSFFSQMKAFEGLDITLEAGFDPNGVITNNKLGYTPIKNRVIYKGQIAGISGNFSTKNSHINITASSYRPHSADNIYRLVIHKGNVIYDNGSKIYSQQDNVINGQTFAQLFSVILQDNVKVFIHPKLKDLKWEQDTSFSTVIKNINELTYTLRKHFKCDIMNDGQNGVICLYPLSQTNVYSKKNSSIIDEKATNKKRAEENSLARSEVLALSRNMNTNAMLQPKELKYSEMLIQPVFQGFSNGLNITSVLRADLTLGSIIKLPEAGVVPAMGGSFATNQQFISEQANLYNITQHGEWEIIKITHKGNFYGKDTQSWCSMMECLPHGKVYDKANTSKQLAKATLDALVNNTFFVRNSY